MPRLLAVPVLAVVLAATVAGCGSGDSSTSSGGSAGYGGGPAKTTTAAKTTAAGTGATATVGTAKNPVGTILVDGTGRSLYVFEADTGSSSTCSGACADVWPPLLTKGTAQATGGAKAKNLGTTKRGDGTMQVTYAGHPLYLYASDSAPGQTTGQDVNSFGASWYVVAPSGKKWEQSES